MSNVRLVVFAKAPEPARVKTRLVPPLTVEEAATVYEACLRDVIAGALESAVQPRILYDDTPGSSGYFARAFPDLERRPQCRGDLGRRMKDAFAALFAEGAAGVVAIGADSPTLPPEYLSAGVSAIAEVGGALGPTTDGGYYLIGLRRDSWPRATELFREMPWSTERVFAITMGRVAQLGMEMRVLPRWYDIDTIDDLGRALRDASEQSHLGRLFSGRESPA